MEQDFLDWTHDVLRRVQAKEALDSDGFRLLCSVASEVSKREASAEELMALTTIIRRLCAAAGVEVVEVKVDVSLSHLDAHVTLTDPPRGDLIIVLGPDPLNGHTEALLAHELYHVANWSNARNWLTYFLPWTGRSVEYAADEFSVELVGRAAVLSLLRLCVQDQVVTRQRTKARRPRLHSMINWWYGVTDSHPSLEKRIRRISDQGKS